MQSEPINIVTPKKVHLPGFIFGSKSAPNLFIFLHGLGGNLFSRIELAQELVKAKQAVLVFNNRGNGVVALIKKECKRQKSGLKNISGGSATEVFTDSVDDILGACQLAKRAGYRNIILLGHSTGANKVAYYLTKKQPIKVKAGILLAPLSDYALIKKAVEPTVLKKAELEARRLVKAKRGDEFLGAKYWPTLISAQRFISLYTASSQEEIFSYSHKLDKGNRLGKIDKPILVISAEQDEYADREVVEINQWFNQQLKHPQAETKLVAQADHGFRGKEKVVKEMMLTWLKNIS